MGLSLFSTLLVGIGLATDSAAIFEAPVRLKADRMRGPGRKSGLCVPLLDRH